MQTYLTRVDQCSRLITGERLNIDQAALIYQEKVEHDRLMQEKSKCAAYTDQTSSSRKLFFDHWIILDTFFPCLFFLVASFHEELRTRLSVDNDEEIFDRLNEIDQLTSDLKS